MKQVLIFLLSFLIINFNSVLSKDKYVGNGQVQFLDLDIDIFDNYLKTPSGYSPLQFWIAVENGKPIWSTYWYCPNSSCTDIRAPKSESKKECELQAQNYYKKNENINKDIECFIFAKRLKIVWDNGYQPENWKQSLVKSSFTKSQIKSKFKELGFYENNYSSISNKTKIKPKIIKKKDTNKITKKYKLSGERSIALSWEGYDELIAGIVTFNEADYKGTLNLPLPNNDGSCDGSYSLQQGGKGTWQIACTNDMGAAGTLKWSEGESVTGSGLDHNNKKVKFTVSKES
jgi:hypothetical protein